MWSLLLRATSIWTLRTLMSIFKTRPKFTSDFNSMTIFWKAKNRQATKSRDLEARQLRSKTLLMKIEFSKSRLIYLQICLIRRQSRMILLSLTMSIQTKLRIIKTSLISFRLKNTTNFTKWQSSFQFLTRLGRILIWWLKNLMEMMKILFKQKSDLILKLN